MPYFRGAVRSVVVCLIVARAVAAGAAEPASRSLLDVPFMAQPAELCGGAAIAMVLRYWGVTDVFPQDFAGLVDKRQRGIPTASLVEAVRARGWQAYVVSEREWERHLANGRPLVALIEVGPNIFHYVVVVGATSDAIVIHDPARAPYRVMSRDEFEAAWKPSGHWLLLALPVEGQPPRAAPHPHVALDPSTSGDACDRLVQAGVEAARAGNDPDAERSLTTATRLCPGRAAPWRELAGLRFAASRWAEARDLAERATRLAPGDDYAWKLLATSRYLSGSQAGALDAWSHVESPRVGTITVEGADRTPQPVIVDALGLEPRQRLTADSFARAQHRLDELPALNAADVRYAVRGGTAAIDAVVDEPAVVPRGLIPLAELAIRPLFLQQVRVDLVGPARSGERWTAIWQWPEPRRDVSFELATPTPGRLPGVVRIDGSWGRQTYGLPDVARADSIEEVRRRGAAHLSDWASGWLRWEAGGSLDHIGNRTYAGIDAAIATRLADERLSVGIGGGSWRPVNGGKAFARTTLQAGWRSTRGARAPAWTALSVLTAATADAPLAVWPGAGTGQPRPALARAHPLLDDNVVNTDAIFGRVVEATTVSYKRPIRRAFGAQVGVAGFVDLARAWRRLGAEPPTPWQPDAGVGLRLHAPGLESVARLDVAVGLRNGRVIVSAGWAPTWTGW